MKARPLYVVEKLTQKQYEQQSKDFTEKEIYKLGRAIRQDPTLVTKTVHFKKIHQQSLKRDTTIRFIFFAIFSFLLLPLFIFGFTTPTKQSYITESLRNHISLRLPYVVCNQCQNSTKMSQTESINNINIDNNINNNINNTTTRNRFVCDVTWTRLTSSNLFIFLISMAIYITWIFVLDLKSKNSCQSLGMKGNILLVILDWVVSFMLVAIVGYIGMRIINWVFGFQICQNYLVNRLFSNELTLGSTMLIYKIIGYRLPLDITLFLGFSTQLFVLYLLLKCLFTFHPILLFWIFSAVALNSFVTLGGYQMGLYRVEIMFWIMSVSATLLYIPLLMAENKAGERKELEDQTTEIVFSDEEVLITDKQE